MVTMQTRMTSGRRGFTLIELLMVILIISVLIALGLAVGARVIGGGKTTQTRELIKVLDNVLNSYLQETGRSSPPASILDPRQEEGNPTGTIVHMPLADGVYRVGGGEFRTINSVGLFLAEARRVAGVSELLDGINPQNLRLFAYTDATSLTSTPGANEPELLTMLDAWGNPIRFVHPAFHGVRTSEEDVEDILGTAPSPATAYFPAEIRRAPGMGDADGGLTTNKPYFYSAGPDGDPSTIEDNVYTVQPRIQKN